MLPSQQHHFHTHTHTRAHIRPTTMFLCHINCINNEKKNSRLLCFVRYSRSELFLSLSPNCCSSYCCCFAPIFHCIFTFVEWNGEGSHFIQYFVWWCVCARVIVCRLSIAIDLIIVIRRYNIRTYRRKLVTIWYPLCYFSSSSLLPIVFSLHEGGACDDKYSIYTECYELMFAALY